MKKATETPVFVRTSERTMFIKCRQAWWWSYKERRKPTESWSPALVFGDMVHRALAEHYIPETRKARKRGPHPAKTFKKIYDVMDGTPKAFNIKVDDEFWIGAGELGVEMLENYMDKWKKEDKRYLVLYPEMPFQFDIKDPDTGLYLCTYVGTTDCLVKDLETGEVGLLEHKTAASIDTGHLFMDEQASTYWTLIPEWLRVNEIFRKQPKFSFMLYNYLRKAQADARPKNDQGQYLNTPTRGDLAQAVVDLGLILPDENGNFPTSKLKKEDLEELLIMKGKDPALFGQVSKVQPPPLFHREIVRRSDASRQNTFQRIVEQVRDMNAVRAGEAPHYKGPSKDCKWCEWRDLCDLHEDGDDWKELRRYATKKWEPYEAHVWALDLA